jgi:hypothetical protein
MQAESTFQAVATQIDRLLYTDVSMSTNLREDLIMSEERGMSRVELSLKGDAVKPGNFCESDLVDVLNCLIEDVFNYPEIRDKVCATLPTKNLIEAYLETPQLHVVMDLRRAWFILARGINNSQYTGWIAYFSSKTELELLIKRMATCHNKIRLIDFENSNESVLLCKSGDMIEIPACTTGPSFFKDRLLPKIKWLSPTKLSNEQIEEIQIGPCPEDHVVNQDENDEQLKV